ncbi:helicase-exonuclease AddAB subunit AddA [Oenococcus sicerae]|uniref:ATP-dependent helicase/nuclease subunit A n=1 Tax=Oenococcus sicerae TaxID=2203724 RepID=A0AAJ1RAY5_9LACO|nr:helicase-exonuclease AddAB subunit AddA [Oenococcus sicerae]MDN6900268.1 helicase-exonuclease AddAB subunit AddA [Oenococcus sicerae]
MRFSKNQQAVISHVPDHNLLVAASAGSGKTTVLVEHVFQQLLSGKNIDHFLISTFTDAAALEMKNRLEKRIREGVLQQQGDSKKHLQDQLLLLNSAAIGTLDSFSLRIIERYYPVIALDPRYRILADQTEKDLLVKDVLDRSFEDFYHEESFLALVANFASASHDQELKNLIIKLNTMAETRTNPDRWLDSISANYQMRDGLTAGHFWDQLLSPQITARAKGACFQLMAARDKIQGLDDYRSYGPYLTDAIALIQKFLNIVPNHNWQQLYGYYNQQDWPKSGRKSGNTEGEAAYFEKWVKPWIDDAKRSYKSLGTDFFYLSEAQWLTVSDQSLAVIAELIKATKIFRQNFANRKRALSLLDFSDGEQFAFQILQDKQIRLEVQSQFDEVLVDEYQDVNDLQEGILTSVANGNNFFMVGDLKQSIYGFRQADPQNFTKKYEAYKNNQGGQLIELAENYRSQRNVTNFTNCIFDQVMDRQLGGIDYKGDVQLQAANQDYPKDLPNIADLSIYDIDKENSDDEDFNTKQAEIKIVAAKIQQLVANGELFDRQSQKMRPILYRDITILSRSHAWENDIQAVFSQYHIPVNVAAGNFLQEFEISVILSFLKIIDNPHQDIPLAAVLHSPIFGLDENQLAEVRTADMVHDYYSAVAAYAQAGDDLLLKKQLSDFLTQLVRYRQLAANNQIVDLIWQIYNDTNWPEYVAGMVGGDQRRANLHALYQYAQQLSDNHFVGLFSFIRYIEQLMNSVEDFAQAPIDAGQQAVSVMTIHAAKGLEFPIVFLLNLDKKIDSRDTNGAMVTDFDYGIGIDFVHPVSRVKVKTIQKIVVANKIKEKNWAEEMRLLYVALTRAEQQLYLVGSTKKVSALIHEWGTPVSTKADIIAIQDRMRASSYQAWIGMALAKTKHLDLEHIQCHYQQPDLTFDLKTYDAKSMPEIQAKQPLPLPDTTIHDKAAAIDLRQIKKILDYKYPYAAESTLAAYHNVSELKRLFEDPDALLMPDMNQGQTAKITELPLPQFALTSHDEQVSSTDKGTAVHLILEKIDWQALLDETYLRRLVRENISDPIIAQSIELDKIMWFINSDLGQEIKKRQAGLKREQTFAMLLPADRIYEGVLADDPVLVHGIMDGYFADGTGITLFDYKADRLTKDYIGQLKARYAGQLNLYAEALASMYPDEKVVRKVIVALEGKQLIDL